MGASSVLISIPSVEMTPRRMSQWEDICQKASSDELVGVFDSFFDEAIGKRQHFIARLLALRDEYGEIVQTYRADVSAHWIDGRPFMSAIAVFWDEVDRNSAVHVFGPVSRFTKLYDWLYEEALKDALVKRPDDVHRLFSEIRNALSQSAQPLVINGATAREMIASEEGQRSLSKAIELTDEAAEVLGGHEGGLNLRGLIHLSKEGARMLSRHKGNLDLRGVVEISPVAIRWLARNKGALFLGGLRSMDEALARGLSALAGDLDLSGLPEITPTVAAILAGRKRAAGCSLYLNGLTHLSVEIADALALFRGDLFLNGLSEINDQVAESLSKQSGGLHLRGVGRLSDKSISLLARRRPCYRILVEWYDKPAKDCDKHQRSMAGSLDLSGLSALSVDAARSLSRHRGYLVLGGLVTLSESAALHLAKHRGPMELGVDSAGEPFPRSVANLLAKCEYEVYFRYWAESTQNVTDLPEEHEEYDDDRDWDDD